ncbi:MAG: mannose-1-phosphate guanylyltransferase/mannose-6-phosphate isomerase [Desulfovibrionaceae bacterium]
MPTPAASRPAVADPLARCHAVILAGGSGTRLWPLSRNLLPKQLLALGGEASLLQQTAARVLGAFPAERVWVVTNEEHVFGVRAQVRAVDPALEPQVVAEPLARDTLPAVLLALEQVARLDDEALVAVFPSDHMVRGEAAWREALVRGAALAEAGRFVTFGIAPTKPETGYGYIATGRPLGDGAFEVDGFVEKPDAERAAAFLHAGSHDWNSGMFLFKMRDFLKAVARHQPELWDWWLARTERPLAEGYRGLPRLSVDYGVLEHLDTIVEVRAGFEWDDLGNWEAVYRLGDKDAVGNLIQGDVLNLGSEGSLLVSRGGKLAAIGLKDMIVVQTRDATLVCPVSEVQRVKDVVQTLKAEGSPLVECHPLVHRPWGSYCVLEEGPRYKIKRIEVKPGAQLSRQMHHHRSEHWVVVQGSALVEVGGQERLLVENQSVDIPMATTHRLANPGKVLLEIIEIQSGSYLEEDDIVRYEDVYGRAPTPDRDGEKSG